ncbi:DMT family transporter [Haloarchaeobius sp. HRN-SO-5]|uniref:DMT family transporter n=1 Tax=Haloarchaeobius sp. HRN-SO-5 TaxID=3446118 RepID=UPI003EBEED11
MTTGDRTAVRTRRVEFPGTTDQRFKTTALFVLVVLVMGGGYVAIDVGVGTVPPLLLAALRFYLTAAVLVAVAVLTGGQWLPRTRADWTAVGVLGVLVFAGAIGFLFVGQQRTSASVAAVVMSLGPVLTAALARALLPDERLSGRQFAGLASGLLGALVVVDPGSTGFAPGTGAAMVLCAAGSGSLGGVLLGRVRATASPTVQAAWGALLGGLVLHAASVCLGEPADAVVWTPALLGLLAYLSVMVGGVGYVAYLVLLRTVGPTRTSYTSYASPVVAILLGWVLLHDPPTVGTAVGFVAIVVGFALLQGGVGSRRDGAAQSNRGTGVRS